MKPSAQRSSASAVIVVLALLGILSLFVMANVRTLARLKHDVKLIEQRQLQRITPPRPPGGPASPLTNSPAIVPTITGTTAGA